MLHKLFLHLLGYFWFIAASKDTNNHVEKMLFLIKNLHKDLSSLVNILYFPFKKHQKKPPHLAQLQGTSIIFKSVEL